MPCRWGKVAQLSPGKGHTLQAGRALSRGCAASREGSCLHVGAYRWGLWLTAQGDVRVVALGCLPVALLVDGRRQGREGWVGW